MNFKVAGIDPGRNIGISIFEGEKLQLFDSLKISQKFPESIYEAMTKLKIALRGAGIDYFAVEAPQPRQFEQRAKRESILKLAFLTGGIIASCWQNDPAGVTVIYPHEHKGPERNPVTINRINRHFNIKVNNDHEANAISVGWCMVRELQFKEKAGQWSNRLRFLKNGS